MDGTVGTASVLITITAAGPIPSEHTTATDTTTRMAIATTTMAAIPIMDMLPVIITGLHITDGPTIHGQRRSLMGGAGADRRGTDTMVLISRPIGCIRRQRSG